MYVYTSEENSLEELVNQDNEMKKKLISDREDLEEGVIGNMDSIIHHLKRTIQNWGDNVMDKTVVNRDVLLGSLRRIQISYNELIDNRTLHDTTTGDIREIHSLNFFHNAKAYITVLNKLAQSTVDQEKRKVFTEITHIRNHFAHAYEKDFLGAKAVVRINPNHHIPRNGDGGIFELFIYDFDTSAHIFSIHYSLNLYYWHIQHSAILLSDYIVKQVADSK